MRTIITKQWTNLAVEEVGAGDDTIVYVHDAAADHTEAHALASLVGARFRVLAPDRRGRGESEDEPHHGLAREAESDILAVVNSCSTPVTVVGHGYGAALCVRMAPLAQTPIRSLVLIDGGVVVVPPGADADPALTAVADEVEQCLAAGDDDQAVERYLRDVCGLDAGAMAAARAAPSWPTRVRCAVTVPREVRALAAASLSGEQARGIRAHTLLVETTAAPEWVRRGYGHALEVLPDARRVTLDGAAPLLLEEDTAELAALVTAVAALPSPRAERAGGVPQQRQ